MNFDPEPEASPIAKQAADWAVRLNAATPAERAEFERWIRESPDHAREFLLELAFERDLKRYVSNDPSILRDLDLIEPADDARIERYAVGVSHPDLIARPKRAWAWRAVMSLVVVAFLAVWGMTFDLQSGQTIQTDAGEWRTIVLDEGTIVRVGPRTRLAVEFDEQRRAIEFSRGEALFHVAKDPKRPFTVYTDTASVQAVGTTFEVAEWQRELKVRVSEGVVVVARTEARDRGGVNPSTEESVTVRAGEHVTVSAAGVARGVADARRSLDWASRAVVYNQESIEQVIADFNRRNDFQIALRDPALRKKSVTGIFTADDPKAFLLYLEADQRVTVIEDEGSGVAYVVPTPEPSRDEASGHDD